VRPTRTWNMGLRHYGVEPDATPYRSIELPVARITDAASMPHRLWDRSMAEAVEAGVDLPPLVVFRHGHGDGWGRLDGVNRANAYVVLGVRQYVLTNSWRVHLSGAVSAASRRQRSPV
jgi:hypothetical protein